MIIGGKELGPETLSNFFALHTTVLPTILIILLGFHFWRIRKSGGLAAGSTEGNNPAVKEDRIEVVPHLMVREMAMAMAVLAVVMIMAALWDAPLAAKANPGLSPNPTKAPWYFAGLQELLLHLPPRLAATMILLMVVLLALLPFLPYPIDAPGRWFGSVRGGCIAALAALLAIVLMPIWIIGHANNLGFSTWLVPLIGLAVMMGIYWFLKRTYGATPHEGVQAAFSFMTMAFILLTLTGIWFRGKSMALAWPW
jgi:quinol-cytochrome oxidoreductase complex cytochrome b subunit